MKSFMKKAVCILLAAVLLCTPVVTNAAVGDSVPMPDTYIWNGDVVTVEAGATTYFEIGTEGSTGTYDFVVEGSGDFSVAVCTEGYVDADFNVFYTEGTPVSAVDGKVETTITSFEYSYSSAAFSITNKTDAAVDYTCNIVYPEGTQGNPKAVTLGPGNYTTVTVPAGGAEYWIAVTLPEYDKEYQLTITGNTGFAYTQGWMLDYDTNGTCTAVIAQYWGPASFAIVNNTGVDQTYTLALDNMPLGAESNPDPEFTVGAAYELELKGNAYWYTWTAPEAGTLTFTVDTEKTENWTYYVVNNISYVGLNFSTAWEEYDKYTNSLEVSAGDEILIGVSIPEYVYDEDWDEYYWDAYGTGKGTYAFSTAFVPADGDDVVIEENPDDAIVSGDNYVHYDVYLSEGTAEYTLSALYDYTLFSFAPTEKGKYIISSENGRVGIVSYNAMWVTVTPGETTVKADPVSWECSGVGQEIWVAVYSDSATAIITVEKDEAEVKVTERIVYENIVTPEAFTFTGDTANLLYVDTFDDVCDTAVLGNDGYYHLNSADGPVLYANLNDSIMSLYAAMGYGQLKNVIYDEDGFASTIIDYNTAFGEYYDCCDTKTKLYPLTEDLIAMFREVGRNQGWYGTGGWIGGKLDDAWMFACYYNEKVEEEVKLGDVDGDGNINSIDSNMLMRVIAGSSFIEEGSKEAVAADINGDGQINAIDANLMKRLLAGAN